MHTVNPVRLMRDYWHNRMLIKQLVKKEIYGRFQGTQLGIFWVILEPLLMLAVYVFVFRVVFERHWNTENETTLEFSIMLFAGLMIFNLFREVTAGAPRLILKNVNYVKKVVFPLEVLPLVSILSGLYHLAVSIFILSLIYIISNGHIHLEVMYIPLILTPYVIMLFGVSMFLAAIGVYLRDIAQIIGMIVMAILFMSAIFYPIESVPDKYHIWFYLNPVAFTVDQFRSVFILGQSPDWNWLLFYYPMSFVIFIFSFIWFQKVRKGFADVL